MEKERIGAEQTGWPTCLRVCGSSAITKNVRYVSFILSRLRNQKSSQEANGRIWRLRGAGVVLKSLQGK